MNKNKNYFFNPLWAKEVAMLDHGEFCSFSYEDGDDEFYFQYIKKDISYELDFLNQNEYFDIITPFDYGGFYYTSTQVLKKGLLEFESNCKKENIISGFFRFASLLKMDYKVIDNYIDTFKIQDHITIDLKTDYLKKFSKRKMRNINKAKRNKYKFIKNDSIDNFYKIYIETMSRVNSDEYFKFSNFFLNNLLKFGKIFSIEYEGKSVSSIYIIEDTENIYYFLGGTLSSYLQYGFNSLLFYLISEYYKDSNKIFYLGGGKDGLYEFKKDFSNDTTPFFIGKKIFNKDIYDKLIVQTNRQENNFFPQYRKKII